MTTFDSLLGENCVTESQEKYVAKRRRIILEPDGDSDTDVDVDNVRAKDDSEGEDDEVPDEEQEENLESGEAGDEDLESGEAGDEDDSLQLVSKPGCALLLSKLETLIQGANFPEGSDTAQVIKMTIEQLNVSVIT
jgi:hypothetical protein